MKGGDLANNLALGLGVAVLGFAMVKYFQTSRGVTSGGGLAPTSSGAAPITGTTGGGTGLGSLWQSLTFPLGTATGGTNMLGYQDQVYSSTSYNPDDISATLGNDALAAMGVAGQSTANQYGFHL